MFIYMYFLPLFQSSQVNNDMELITIVVLIANLYQTLLQHSYMIVTIGRQH